MWQWLTLILGYATLSPVAIGLGEFLRPMRLVLYAIASVFCISISLAVYHFLLLPAHVSLVSLGFCIGIYEETTKFICVLLFGLIRVGRLPRQDSAPTDDRILGSAVVGLTFGLFEGIGRVTKTPPLIDLWHSLLLATDVINSGSVAHMALCQIPFLACVGRKGASWILFAIGGLCCSIMLHGLMDAIQYDKLRHGIGLLALVYGAIAFIYATLLYSAFRDKPSPIQRQHPAVSGVFIVTFVAAVIHIGWALSGLIDKTGVQFLLLIMTAPTIAPIGVLFWLRTVNGTGVSPTSS